MGSDADGPGRDNSVDGPGNRERRFGKRYYAPIRRLPPVEEWPAADQVGWSRACLHAGPLEPPGRLAHLKPLALDQARMGWARYLSFLSVSDELSDLDSPAERLTPERLGRFIQSLRDRMSPRSVQGCVYSLFTAVRAMEPDHDWRWVCAHHGRPRNAEVELGRKRIVPPDPAELLSGALDYCDAADRAQGRGDQASIRFRDGLIVAFGTYFALRRRNIFEPAIGEHLLVGDSGIRVLFDTTVKNGEIIDSDVPEMLEPYMRRYLAHHRIVLLQRGPGTSALWVNLFGQPLSYAAIYDVFQRVSKRATSRCVNVHSVRYAMATTTLDNDVTDIEFASAGLAHIGTSSVARVYDKGGDARANRAYHAILKRRRGRRSSR